MRPLELCPSIARIGAIADLLLINVADGGVSDNLKHESYGVSVKGVKDTLSSVENLFVWSSPAKVNLQQFDPYSFSLYHDAGVDFVSSTGSNTLVTWVSGGRKITYSDFNGSQWQVPTVLDDDSATRSTDQYVMTGRDGNAVILFRKILTDNSNVNRLAISRDGGQNFSIEDINIPTSYYFLRPPVLGANDKIIFLASYADNSHAYSSYYRVSLLTYDPDLKTFTSLTKISEYEQGPSYNIPMRVFADNLGKMFAVWINRDGSLKYRRSLDNGNTFEETLVFAPENGVEYSLPSSAARDNTVAMVWSDRTALQMLLSHNGGQSFGEVRSIAYPDSGSPQLTSPTVAIDSKGNMVVGWTKVPASGLGFDFVYITSNDRGSTFSAPVTYSDFKTQTRETPSVGEFLFDKYDRLQIVLATLSNNLWFVKDIKPSLMPRPFADLPFDYDLNRDGVESPKEFGRATRQYYYADGRTRSIYDHENPNYEQDGVILTADGRRITNAFGSDCTPQGRACGYRMSPDSYYIYYDGHDGVDILPVPGSADTPILAIAEGTVINVKKDENEDPDFGEMVEVKHSNGVISRYGHLRRGSITVNVGDTVTRDKDHPIGIMGSTGNSTAEHLHLTLAHDVDGSNTIELDEKMDPFYPDTYLWVKPWIADEFVDPVIGANLTIPDMGISMQIQPEVVTQTLRVIVGRSTTAPPPDNFAATNVAFNAESIDTNGQEITNFARPITLSVSYTDLDLSNINEDSLRLYFWNQTNAAWEVLETILDKINRTAQVSLTSFGSFALLGEMIVSPTATPTATQTEISTPTATVTITPTSTQTETPSVTSTETPTATSTETATETSTPSDTPTETATAAFIPTQTEIPQSTPTPIPSGTATATQIPTQTITPMPDNTPTPVVLPSPTRVPEPTATLIPPDPSPTIEPEPTPSGPRTIFIPIAPNGSNQK